MRCLRGAVVACEDCGVALRRHVKMVAWRCGGSRRWLRGSVVAREDGCVAEWMLLQMGDVDFGKNEVQFSLIKLKFSLQRLPLAIVTVHEADLIIVVSEMSAPTTPTYCRTGRAMGAQRCTGLCTKKRSLLQKNLVFSQLIVLSFF